jgi:hypothetical protein
VVEADGTVVAAVDVVVSAGAAIATDVIATGVGSFRNTLRHPYAPGTIGTRVPSGANLVGVEVELQIRRRNGFTDDVPA